MSQVLDRPGIIFEDQTSENPFDMNIFPDKVWVLHHPSTDRYGCNEHKGIHGVACFSNEGRAIAFTEWISLSGMTTKEVDFDEARDIAKSRPLPCVSLQLLDDIQNPQIHFVR